MRDDAGHKAMRAALARGWGWVSQGTASHGAGGRGWAEGVYS
jgi:hypothetical protein